MVRNVSGLVKKHCFNNNLIVRVKFLTDRENTVGKEVIRISIKVVFQYFILCRVRSLYFPLSETKV